MRLDADDPVEAWQEHAADAPHALGRPERGGGSTPFGSVGRAPTSWSGSSRPRAGCARPSRPTSGIEHLPNIPTEEVFTTPDWRRTTGSVRSTYPLIVPGVFARVDGLEVRFEEGRIVDVKADGDGADMIQAQLESDAQAPYLGEIALVDGSSRIRQTGLVFHDTLFDENASCHIAYGSGLPMAVDGVDGARRRGAARCGRQRLRHAHGLHDRRLGGRGRRARQGRVRDADHPRRPVGALACSPRIRQEPNPAA